MNFCSVILQWELGRQAKDFKDKWGQLQSGFSSMFPGQGWGWVSSPVFHHSSGVQHSLSSTWMNKPKSPAMLVVPQLCAAALLSTGDLAALATLAVKLVSGSVYFLLACKLSNGGSPDTCIGVQCTAHPTLLAVKDGEKHWV